MRKINLSVIAILSAASLSAQTTVFSEDFQSGIPVDFTLIDNDGLTPHADVSEYTEAWISITDTYDNTDTVAASTSYFDPSGAADRWLITPAITLGDYGNTINWNARSQDASYLDSYYVLVSTTDAQMSSFEDTLRIVLSENFEWTARDMDLSEAGYDNQTVHFAFVNRTNDGFKLYIDDIEVISEDPVGVTENESIIARIYPNPALNELNILVEDYKETGIYDMLGNKVFASSDSKIDISTLPSGMYHVKISTETGVTIKNLVKN